MTTKVRLLLWLTDQREKNPKLNHLPAAIDFLCAEIDSLRDRLEVDSPTGNVSEASR